MVREDADGEIDHLLCSRGNGVPLDFEAFALLSCRSHLTFSASFGGAGGGVIFDELDNGARDIFFGGVFDAFQTR